MNRSVALSIAAFHAATLAWILVGFGCAKPSNAPAAMPADSLEETSSSPDATAAASALDVSVQADVSADNAASDTAIDVLILPDVTENDVADVVDGAAMDEATDAPSDIFIEPDIVTDGPPVAICVNSQQCKGTKSSCAVATCIKGLCQTVAAADGTPCADCGFMPTCKAGVCQTIPLTYTKMFTAPGLDQPRVLLHNPTGDYFIIGERKVVPGNQDILILRVDATGKLLWEQTFNFAGIEDVTAATLDAEGLLIAGHFSDGMAGTWDAQLVRVNLDGKLLWRKVNADKNNERLFALVAVGVEGWLAAGEVGPSPAPDAVKTSAIWALRVDKSGNELLWLTYASPQNDWALAATVLADGGWLLAGQTTAGTAPGDAIAVRTDGNGKELWKKVWPTPQWNRFTSAVTLPSGDIALGGTSRGPLEGATYDAWLLRLNPAGDTLSEEMSHDAPGINRIVNLSTGATDAVDYLVIGTDDPEDTGSQYGVHLRRSWVAAIENADCDAKKADQPAAMVVQGGLSVTVGRSGAQIYLQRAPCQACKYGVYACQCNAEDMCLQSICKYGNCAKDFLATQGMPCTGGVNCNGANGRCL